MSGLPNCYRCGNQPCTCKDGLTIYHADCREILPLLDKDSIDLVLTDPPYPKKYDEVWDALKLCYQSMIDGSYLVTFLGHYQLPRVMGVLCERFSYVWCVCLPNNNQPIMHGYSVKCCWKPCLVFSKGKGRKPNRIWYDNFALRSQTRMWSESQKIHKWGQSCGMLYEPIDAFGSDGGITLDPFLGGGTTLRVCKDMGRRGVGIEIEEKCCEASAKRLQKGSFGIAGLLEDVERASRKHPMPSFDLTIDEE